MSPLVGLEKSPFLWDFVSHVTCAYIFPTVETQKRVREVYFFGQPHLFLSWYIKCNETQHWQAFKLLKFSHGREEQALLSCCFSWSIKLPKQMEEDLMTHRCHQGPLKGMTAVTEGGRCLLSWKWLYREFLWHNIPSWALRDNTTSYLPFHSQKILHQILEGKMHRGKCRNKAYYYSQSIRN